MDVPESQISVIAPTWSARGITTKSIILMFTMILYFAVYESWEAVHSLQMMSQGVGTFSTTENLILSTDTVLLSFD